MDRGTAVVGVGGFESIGTEVFLVVKFFFAKPVPVVDMAVSICMAITVVSLCMAIITVICMATITVICMAVPVPLPILSILFISVYLIFQTTHIIPVPLPTKLTLIFILFFLTTIPIQFIVNLFFLFKIFSCIVGDLLVQTRPTMVIIVELFLLYLTYIRAVLALSIIIHDCLFILKSHIDLLTIIFQCPPSLIRLFYVLLSCKKFLHFLVYGEAATDK